MKAWMAGVGVACAAVVVGAVAFQGRWMGAQDAAAEREREGAADRDERTDSPREAAAYYLAKRLPPGVKELPVEQLLAARAAMDKMPHVSSATHQQVAPGDPVTAALSASWTALGPGNVGGRVLSFAVDPTNGNILYAGSAGGGVWKSTDAGANWAATSDTMANLAVAALAMDPTDHLTLYAGTGEGDGAIDSIRGAGIFKSTDGAATWTRLAFTAGNSSFNYVNDIRVSKMNHLRVVAATGSGVWTSNDGGATFTKTQTASSCFYVVSSVTAGVESWLASCNGPSTAVYRSVTDAASWTNVLGTGETGMGRTAIAIQGTRAYAVAASTVGGFDRTGDGNGDYSAQLHAFFRSNDSGQTWTPMVRNSSANWGSTLILSGYYSCATYTGAYGQGWYDNTIAIDPLNVDSVWVGGISLYRSDDGGTTWGRGPNIHTDHHVLTYDPAFNGSTNQRLYVGEDGGIYRMDNSRAATGNLPATPSSCGAATVSATSLNHSFAATQFYHGTPYPDGTKYIAGAQDNGIRRGTDAGGINGWAGLACGDGGYTAVDPTNTNNLYVACQGIDIEKSTNGGSSFVNADNGIPSGESAIFIPPFALDPNTPSRLWWGGKHAFRTDDSAANWTGASAQFANGTVSAIAVAPGNSNRVLMGTSAGRVYRSETATTDTSASAWTEYTVNAGGYISALAFAPGNPNVVYASISTFGRPHALKSIDGGATWANISGSGSTGLPDVPALSIVVDVGDTSRVFVGTDVGVFTSADGGATWAVEITGFPNVSTEWLSMTGNATNRSLFAFTHGRGTFRAVLGPALSDIIFQNGFQ